MEFNQTQPTKSFEPLRLAAEQILSAYYSDRINIKSIERFTEPGRRNMLLRCWIDPVENLPSSFILKKVEGKYNPNDANSADTRRLFDDWIGSKFLNQISTQAKHSPCFYGGDRDLGFILIEDVQHHNTLAEILLGNDSDKAEWALLQYATCLGQLHRDTLGKADDFYQLYKTVSKNMKPYKARVDIDRFGLILESIGINPHNNCLSDLEAIHQTVNNPGELMAYIHFDACPDNVLNTGSELRLIDFETGFFSHALLDAVFGRMMFPSCWCSKRLPENIVLKMENVYREILIQKCPAAADDKTFNRALVYACGWWLIDTLLDLKQVWHKDEDFGVSTIRQRILARSKTFIAVSQEFNLLPGLRGTSSQLLDLLNQVWSDVPDLPLYPAFE